MNYLLLLAPVCFSAIAQLLLKTAAKFEFKTFEWGLSICLAIAAYLIAFVLYSFAVRQYPLSIASAVTTIATVLIVMISATFLFGEIISLKQAIGITFGLMAIGLLLT